MISKQDVVQSILGCLSIMLCWFMGYVLNQYIFLPASLLGLLILFVVLVCLRRVPKFLLSVSQFFLGHLSFFFIPPLVVAWLYAEQIGERLWLFFIAIICSTLLSLYVTSWLGQRFLKPPIDSTNTDEHV